MYTVNLCEGRKVFIEWISRNQDFYNSQCKDCVLSVSNPKPKEVSIPFSCLIWVIVQGGPAKSSLIIFFLNHTLLFPDILNL